MRDACIAKTFRMLEYMLFQCAHWDQFSLIVKVFFGGRKIRVTGVEDFLCESNDIPTTEEDCEVNFCLTEAATRNRIAFYSMVEVILGCKK